MTEVIEPYGPVKGTVGFFVGCMYNLRLPKTALDALEVLRRNGIRVIIPHEQICCGSPLIRTGQPEYLETLQAKNIGAFTPVRDRYGNDHMCRLRVNPKT